MVKEIIFRRLEAMLKEKGLIAKWVCHGQGNNLQKVGGYAKGKRLFLVVLYSGGLRGPCPPYFKKIYAFDPLDFHTRTSSRNKYCSYVTCMVMGF